jgi:hypothetical protein
MKYFSAFLIFLLWSLLSLVLILTIVGLVIILSDEWLGIAYKILQVYDKDKNSGSF